MRNGNAVFWTACLVLPGALSAQEQAAQNVVAIEFSGLHRTTASFAQDIVRLRPGDKSDKAALDEAVARLLRTGRFQTVSYKLDEQPEGVRVVFEVHERTIVSKIDFEGNSKFRDGQLKDSVTQKIGEVADWFAVRDGRESIVANTAKPATAT